MTSLTDLMISNDWGFGVLGNVTTCSACSLTPSQYMFQAATRHYVERKNQMFLPSTTKTKLSSPLLQAKADLFKSGKIINFINK